MKEEEEDDDDEKEAKEYWNKKASRFHVIRRNDEDTNKPWNSSLACL